MPAEKFERSPSILQGCLDRQQRPSSPSGRPFGEATGDHCHRRFPNSTGHVDSLRDRRNPAGGPVYLATLSGWALPIAPLDNDHRDLRPNAAAVRHERPADHRGVSNRRQRSQPGTTESAPIWGKVQRVFVRSRGSVEEVTQIAGPGEADPTTVRQRDSDWGSQRSKRLPPLRLGTDDALRRGSRSGGSVSWWKYGLGPNSANSDSSSSVP